MNEQALSGGEFWKVEGDKLRVTEAFYVYDGSHNPERRLTIPEGFVSDGYTGVWNPPDELPAISHDRAYEFQRWDFGSPVTFEQANNMLYYLMSISKDFWTRRLAMTYWLGVTLFGRMFWRDQVKFSVKGIFRRKSRFGGMPLKMA
jgi:hypothetical protein